MNLLREQKGNILLGNWYVWLFPIFALLIAGWLFLQNWKERGPEIYIHFEDGSSIRAEKTKVRFRGVTIGTVKKIVISDDDKDVIATVLLQSEAQNFAVEGSKFWLVMPKVGFQGVSGLETIFEGTYIAAIPGSAEAPMHYDFHGKIGGDSDEALEESAAYFLETINANSLDVGESVSFRGLKIGVVTKLFLPKGAQHVTVQINIHNKFRHLIRTNTAFWRKVAVQANLGLFNSEVKIGSLDAILHGGVDLFTPDNPGEVAKPGSHFEMSPSAPKGSEKWNPRLE